MRIWREEIGLTSELTSSGILLAALVTSSTPPTEAESKASTASANRSTVFGVPADTVWMGVPNLRRPCRGYLRNHYDSSREDEEAEDNLRSAHGNDFDSRQGMVSW